MAKKKKIEDEIKDAQIKVNEIEAEVDINEVNIEAESISNVKFILWDKEYNASELMNLIEKENKTYFEKELVKKFKLLMQNYYTGIKYAILRSCCGKKHTLQDLKNKLTEKDIYSIIDMRCSRDSIRFNKETVDFVIDFAEKYNF